MDLFAIAAPFELIFHHPSQRLEDNGRVVVYATCRQMHDARKLIADI